MCLISLLCNIQRKNLNMNNHWNCLPFAYSCSYVNNVQLLLAGGRSLGCPENAGAAGTYYDAIPRKLIVSNHNLSTRTDTLLLEFPKLPLWTNVDIKDHAKALVPLYWSRVQVIEELTSFPLTSEFFH